MADINTLAQYAITFLGKCNPEIDEVLHQLTLSGSFDKEKRGGDFAREGDSRLPRHQGGCEPEMLVAEELLLSLGPTRFGSCKN
jgi:hypothetical protein